MNKIKYEPIGHDSADPEVRGQVEIGVDLEFFSKDEKMRIADIRRIERMLGGYIRYVEKKNVK